MRSAAVLVLTALFASLPAASAEPKPFSSVEKFARCLAEKKAIMYGAFWCSHCDEQKKLFGDAFKYVPYVECAVPGTRKRTEECTKLNIARTPTWIFANGERLTGALTFQRLSEKTGCKLP